jgi:small subunit ribosomal protein S21
LTSRKRVPYSSFESSGLDTRTIAFACILSLARARLSVSHEGDVSTTPCRLDDPERGREVLSPLAEIRVNENESIESALRRFKRKVQQEDIIKEIKKHSFYMKPGDKRRAKQALARKRQRKKMRREQSD